MAAKDFKELIKAQQETTKALMSAEDAAKYDTILTERQFEFDKKSEAAKQGAETKRVSAAAAAEKATRESKLKDQKEANEVEGRAHNKKLDADKISSKKIAAALEKTKTLTASALGISVKDYEQRQGREESLKKQSEELKLVREGIEKNGGKAEDNLKFNKLNYQLEKAKLAERLKNATNPAARKEIKNEQRALAEKQSGLLGSIARGMSFLRKSAKEKLASAGKGIMNLLKTTFIAGFAIAAVAFLNSKYWVDTKEFIIKKAAPAIKDFYFKTLKPFVMRLMDFFKDPTWESFMNVFSPTSEDGLVKGLAGITKDISPLTLLAGLALGIVGLKKGFNFLGGKLGGMLGGMGIPGFGGEDAKGGGSKSKSKNKKIKGGKKGGFFGGALASIGTGLGAGIGGILRGIALGLTSFANPAVLLGSVNFGLAIAAIGVGIAGATWLVGKSLPAFAEGMKSFQELDGAKLVEVSKGLIAIGKGMAAFGAGKAIEGVGSLVSSISGFFGGKGKLTPLEQLKIFSDTKINAAQATANAKGLVSYSKAMAMAGSASAAKDDGFFSAIGKSLGGFVTSGDDSTLDKLKKFGNMDINASGIMKNSKAVAEYSKAISLMKGDITGADLVNAERANRVNQAGVERSGGGGGAPVIVNAPTTSVIDNSSSSSSNFNTPLLNNNPSVNAVNYSY
jgi:hypothetical protein